MTQDTNDPFAPRDATVLRPRPGAGKRSPGDRVPPPGPSRPSSTPSSGRSALPGAMRDFMAAGLNPLVQAASPLLILMGRLRGMRAHADVSALRRETLEQIRTFEDQARAGGIAPDTINAARYVLCSGLDEAVLSTPWGGQSEWAGHTLLVTLHRDTKGGEKFFEILDGISADPDRHIDMLELMYVCLALGFGGKYQLADRGHSQLADIQTQLYRRIRDVRGVPPPELSLRWRGMQDRRNPVVRYVPWWVVAALALVIVTGTFIYYHLRLAEQSAPIDAELAQIGVTQPIVTATAAPSVAPRLRQLLADEISHGILKVDERGNQSVVTLLATDLFGSGRASVNPAYYPVMRRIANALNEVPGRVFVIGHTDDQPVRSLQFRDNFDLSRARALDVVKLLSLAINDPGRLEPSGLGSSKPLYTPENLPENRARNRRVEIIQVNEG